MEVHTCIQVSKDCINYDSYGEICVGCNACGRFDKSTQNECALKLYKRMLQEQYDFNNWTEGFEEIQKKNIKSNIEFLKNKILELEKALKEGE